jgi:hypothetical protein
VPSDRRDAQETISKRQVAQKPSREAGDYEAGARIKNGYPDIHRQVDAPDFIFVEGEAISSRAIATPSRWYLAANAYKNSAQSRSHRIDRQECDKVEGDRGRVFLDPNGKDNYRSTARDVPLGKTESQGDKCRRVSSERLSCNSLEFWGSRILAVPAAVLVDRSTNSENERE